MASSGQWAVDMAEDVDDEYWNKPQKRRNFFDDKPTSPTLKESNGFAKKEAPSLQQTLKNAGLDDYDNQESITVDGGVPRFSAGQSKHASSSRMMPENRPNSLLSARGTVPANKSSPSLVSTSVPVSLSTSRSFSTVTDTSTSRSSTPSSSTTSSPAAGAGGNGALGHRRTGSASNVEKKNTSQSSSPVSSHGSTHGSTASIDDAVKRESRPTNTELSKLQAEISALHRKIRNLEKSRWSALPVADTVSRIITGERYSLEPYKSLRDKLSLLDAAIGFHDGNAILAVIIFLRKTLSKTLFHRELSKRPEAVDQYIAFLKDYHSSQDSVAVELGMLGRVEEAALWRYKMANQSKDPRARLNELVTCNSMWFKNSDTLTTEHELINEQVLLQNKQLQIEPRDQRYQQEGRSPFRELPRKTSLYFRPLITTLFYCSLYHNTSQDSDPSNPLLIKKEFNLTDKQYLFQALLARAQLKQWSLIDTLLTSKNWLGKARMKAAINFEQVAYVLQAVKAPSEVIGRYMMLIEDKEARIAMAMRFKHPRVVVDTLVQLRDRQRLLAFRPQCGGPGSLVDTHVEVVLRSPETKWKN